MVHSRARRKGRLAFGVKAGLNAASLAGDAAPTSDTKLGATAGAILRYAIARSVALQPELLLSQKGGGSTSVSVATFPEIDRVHVLVSLPMVNTTVVPFCW